MTSKQKKTKRRQKRVAQQKRAHNKSQRGHVRGAAPRDKAMAINTKRPVLVEPRPVVDRESLAASVQPAQTDERTQPVSKGKFRAFMANLFRSAEKENTAPRTQTQKRKVLKWAFGMAGAALVLAGLFYANTARFDRAAETAPVTALPVEPVPVQERTKQAPKAAPVKKALPKKVKRHYAAARVQTATAHVALPEEIVGLFEKAGQAEGIQNHLLPSLDGSAKAELARRNAAINKAKTEPEKVRLRRDFCLAAGPIFRQQGAGHAATAIELVGLRLARASETLNSPEAVRAAAARAAYLQKYAASEKKVEDVAQAYLEAKATAVVAAQNLQNMEGRMSRAEQAKVRRDMSGAYEKSHMALQRLYKSGGPSNG